MEKMAVSKCLVTFFLIMFWSIRNEVMSFDEWLHIRFGTFTFDLRLFCNDGIDFGDFFLSNGNS